MDKDNHTKITLSSDECSFAMRVVEHHSIGQEVAHTMMDVQLVRFHTLIAVVTDLVADRPLDAVVVDRRQKYHVERMAADQALVLLLHTGHFDSLYTYHTHCM